MKKTILYVFFSLLNFASFAQLKDQIIVLEVIPNDSFQKTFLLDTKSDIGSEKIEIDKMVTPIIVTAATNVVVNSITRILKNRISDKQIDYLVSISDENFYRIKNDSLVTLGIYSFRLKRIKKESTELQIDIKPLVSENKNFFKWRIENPTLTRGGFKKKPKGNVDIELKINFNYFSKKDNEYQNIAFTEQIINIYSAQNKSQSRVLESNWMPIPSFIANSKVENPVYNLSISVKEMTALSEIYKEIVKEDDAFNKSLTELINKLTKSISKP